MITRGLEIALLLAAAPQVQVVMLGGRVQPISHGLVGPLTGLALDRLAPDVAFLGADAVHPRRGVGEPKLEEAAVKEHVAARARRVVVLADGSELDVQAVPAWAQLPVGWSLVTDDAGDAVLADFADAGARVWCAAPGGD